MTALFQAAYWQGGESELKIRFRREDMSTINRQLLYAALTDLSIGLMTIGGNAATGLGRIQVEKMEQNGKTESLGLEVNDQ